MTTSSTRLEQNFNRIVKAALAGERCPFTRSREVPQGELDGGAVAELCRIGRIKVEISGQNFRQAIILKGEYAGRKTAPNPSRHAHVWKTIGKTVTLDTSVTRRMKQKPSLANIRMAG